MSLLPPLGGGGRGRGRGLLPQPPSVLSPFLSPSTAAAAAASSSPSPEELDLSGPPFYDEINPDVDDDHARRRDVKVENRSHNLERHVVGELRLALLVCKEKKIWKIITNVQSINLYSPDSQLLLLLLRPDT